MIPSCKITVYFKEDFSWSEPYFRHQNINHLWLFSRKQFIMEVFDYVKKSCHYDPLNVSRKINL